MVVQGNERKMSFVAQFTFEVLTHKGTLSFCKMVQERYSGYHAGVMLVIFA